MKKWHIAALLSMLFFALALCGCKRNADLAIVEHIVQEINSHPDRELPNGTILSRCDYASGDSLLVYRIRVKDNRFEGKEIDSIKSQIRTELLALSMHKLTSLLKCNDIGIQYVYTTTDTDIVVTFTPDELGGITDK